MASTSTTPGVSRHVTVYITPENETKFLEAFKGLFSQVILNPECKLFEVYRSTESPGTFSWVEDWDGTAEWLTAVKAYLSLSSMAHLSQKSAQEASEDYQTWLAYVETMYAKPREEKIFERMSSDFYHAKTE
ncbi:hypothetical protein HJFPF1_10234 [Paramyrothecium foliicola]|nr:hypothetical protein HJFPF1_10234 [Paramyrothecium foliicola]